MDSSLLILTSHRGRDGRVKFRLVMFAPHDGCILSGYVDSVSREKGVRITMGFFNDIYVPYGMCPEVAWCSFFLLFFLCSDVEGLVKNSVIENDIDERLGVLCAHSNLPKKETQESIFEVCNCFCFCCVQGFSLLW